MQNLSMCRICLATDVRLCSVARSLQDMYEKLTELTFQREDRRPLVACYICHARLRNCYRLRMSCLRSEKLLTEMMTSNKLVPQQVSSINTLRVVSALNLSMGHVLQDRTECPVKEEVLEVIHDAECDQKSTKDIKMETQEEHDVQIDDYTQCSQLEDPLDVTKREPDDVETDGEYIYLEDETKSIEKNRWAPDIAGPSSQSADNICPKIVKVVLERIDLNESRVGARVAKKHKIAASKDTEDATANKRKIEEIKNELTETETVAKQIKVEIEVENPVTTNKILETCDKVYSNVNKRDDNVIISEVNDVCEESVNSVSSSKNCLFSCDTCKKWFTAKSSLRKHMRIHTGVKPYQCNICKKCFIRNDRLKFHILTHTGEKPFQCNVCEKYFNFKHNFNNHIRTHTGDKPYQCHVCKKSFNQKSDLNRHIVRHTGEKPYQCNVCNERFYRNDRLKTHMLSHTGETPHQCNVCKKCFGYKRLLKNHYRKHTGEKPFQCNVCKKCYSYKHLLKIHYRKHTGEKPFQCNVCKKCFALPGSYSSHIRMHNR